jgi:hypothetical protein
MYKSLGLSIYKLPRQGHLFQLVLALDSFVGILQFDLWKRHRVGHNQTAFAQSASGDTADHQILDSVTIDKALKIFRLVGIGVPYRRTNCSSEWGSCLRRPTQTGIDTQQDGTDTLFFERPFRPAASSAELGLG